MLKMSIIGENARVQTFAKVIDSFVNHCLWQVIPDLHAAFIMSTTCWIWHDVNSDVICSV